MSKSVVCRKTEGGRAQRQRKSTRLGYCSRVGCCVLSTVRSRRRRRRETREKVTHTHTHVHTARQRSRRINGVMPLMRSDRGDRVHASRMARARARSRLADAIFVLCCCCCCCVFFLQHFMTLEVGARARRAGARLRFRNNIKRRARSRAH